MSYSDLVDSFYLGSHSKLWLSMREVFLSTESLVAAFGCADEVLFAYCHLGGLYLII